MYYDFAGSRSQGMRKVARRLIIVCYAGLEAQRWYNPEVSDEYSQIDSDDAFELSREYSVLPRHGNAINDEDHHRYLRSLRGEAQRLVKRKWSIIEAVAAELLNRQTLYESDVKSIYASLADD
jgi:hypothetical protein